MAEGYTSDQAVDYCAAKVRWPDYTWAPYWQVVAYHDDEGTDEGLCVEVQTMWVGEHPELISLMCWSEDKPGPNAHFMYFNRSHWQGQLHIEDPRKQVVAGALLEEYRFLGQRIIDLTSAQLMQLLIMVDRFTKENASKED